MKFLNGLAALCIVLAPARAGDWLDRPDRWQWIDTTPAAIRIGGGSLVAQRRSYQSATVVTRDDLENFDLSFDFLVKRWCELILLIHAPRNNAWEAGLELVLSDHPGAAPSLYTTGALLGHVPPKSNPIRKDDEWNSCRIRMDWPEFRAELNGEIIQEIDLSLHPELSHKLRRGALGFRDLLGWGFEVRDFNLTALPDSENGIRLYNGKDLAGWKEVRSSGAKWEANDDILIGRDGNGYLQHELLCQDFDLRLYYRTSPTANGGVFFRWLPDDSDRGNEIQILDVPQSLMPSASIYGIARANPAPIRPGDWNLLQLSVRGNRAVTHLNGVKTAETDNLTKIRPGLITLQMHKENSTIEFKDIVLVPRL